MRRWTSPNEKTVSSAGPDALTAVNGRPSTTASAAAMTSRSSSHAASTVAPSSMRHAAIWIHRCHEPCTGPPLSRRGSPSSNVRKLPCP